MFRSPRTGSAWLGSLTVGLLFPVGSLHAQPPNAATADATELQEVVVTAEKRVERLQDVPISVTALSADQIDALKLNSGTDVARLAPNLRVSVAGNEDQPKFSIRGLSQFDTNLNASSPTGIFYDEVYVASQFLGGPQLYDMQRVEVLRGPQGTLFGKNTTAGAIDFITRAPSLSGNNPTYLSVEGGSNDYYRAEGATDIPLIDQTLAARVAFNTSGSNGWVKNVNPDPNARDLSSIDNHAFRGSLAYKDGDFDATLRIWVTRSSPTAIGIIAYGTCPKYCLTIPGLLPPTPAGTEVSGINPRVNPFTGQPLGVHEAAYDRSGSIYVAGNGGYLTLNQKVGSFTLTSITSYLNGHFKNLVDGDGSIAPLFALDFYAKTEEYGEDLRLTSGFEGPFNFIFGLYYFHDEVDPVTTVHFGSSLAFLGSASTTSFEQPRTSEAAYFDGTYSFTSKAEAYLGIRGTHETGAANDFVVGSAAPLSVSYNETEPTGRAGVRYKFTDELMAYGQYSRGYRSSAINGSAGCAAELNVAKPEFLNAYELGIKSEWLDRRVIANASAFYYDFTNQQFRNPVSGTSGCPGNANPLAQELINAAKSTIYGLEFETLARVTADFDATVGMGLLDSKYDKLTLFDSPNNVTRDLSGNHVLEAPPYTANLALDYRIPFGRLQVALHSDTNWVGKEYFTAFNNIAPWGQDSSPAHWETNARLAFKSSDGKYEFGIWGKNLNNNDAVTWSVSPQAFGVRFTTVPYPRRWGADFRWSM